MNDISEELGLKSLQPTRGTLLTETGSYPYVVGSGYLGGHGRRIDIRAESRQALLASCRKKDVVAGTYECVLGHLTGHYVLVRVQASPFRASSSFLAIVFLPEKGDEAWQHYDSNVLETDHEVAKAFEALRAEPFYQAMPYVPNEPDSWFRNARPSTEGTASLEEHTFEETRRSQRRKSQLRI